MFDPLYSFNMKDIATFNTSIFIVSRLVKFMPEYVAPTSI